MTYHVLLADGDLIGIVRADGDASGGADVGAVVAGVAGDVLAVGGTRLEVDGVAARGAKELADRVRVEGGQKREVRVVRGLAAEDLDIIALHDRAQGGRGKAKRENNGSLHLVGVGRYQVYDMKKLVLVRFGLWWLLVVVVGCGV